MKKKFFKNCPYPHCESCDACPNRLECLNRMCARATKQKRQLVCCESCVRREHCRAKFAQSKREQIYDSAVKMNETLKRKRRRRSSNAATVVKSTAVMRRPKYAYAFAVLNTWMSKISIKGVVKNVAYALAAYLLVRLSVGAIVQIVYDLEGRNNSIIEFYEPSFEQENTMYVGTEIGMEGVSLPEVNITEVDSENATYDPMEVFTATAEGPRPYYIYHFTSEQKLLIAKMVWKEARGECYEGQVACAAVAINRWLMQSPEFGLNIESVIRLPGAFASNVEAVTMKQLESVPSCMEAVEDACRGWDPTRAEFENGALFFYAHNSPDLSEEARAAREGVPSMVIGNHTFHDRMN